jgi:hypothetical protein
MKYRSIIALLIIAILSQCAFTGKAYSEIKADYLYNLSDIHGVVPYSWVNISPDKKNNELYAVNTSDGLVRIFNDAGMEIYRFGNVEGYGSIYDAAVEDDGSIILLSYLNGKYSIVKCDFRGEPSATLKLGNVPEGFSSGFNPTVIKYRDQNLYIADKGSMKVLVAGKDGTCVKTYDLAKLIGLSEKERENTGLAGFNVDNEGDLLFTVPSLFLAYVVTPDGKARSFGVRGSAPGKFNIVGGIASDDKGNIYVVDTLRSVVMVFDKDFKFITEFGGWGFDDGYLVAPMDIGVMNGKVYVTQSRKRGISVYRVLSN